MCRVRSTNVSPRNGGGRRDAFGRINRRQRLTWIAHLAKAIFRQHHRNLGGLFTPHIPEDAVVLDVGAHAGQFSKLFAKLARQGKVYAFEPSGYARSILTQALHWNRLHHVEILPFGLSDAVGAAVLKTPVTASGSVGFGRAQFGADPDGLHIPQVAMLDTLDAFVKARHLRRIDFVKIDVEGWEMHVLRGGVRSLERFRPTLFLEVSDDWLAQAAETPDSIWLLLSRLGYRASLLDMSDSHAPKLIAVPAYAGSGDYLFTLADAA